MGEKLSPSKQQVAGKVVGDRYRLEIDLGRGGMARVYRAVDERSGQLVALKQLSLDDERPAAAQATFEREYHTLVQLAHPHIVRAFEYGLDADGPFYTMELLDGGDAREVTRSQALTVEQICLLLHDAASALALIHSRRLLHRDLSPRNLFCVSGGRAKLIDFGSLAPMGSPAGSAGTPPFVPPEVVHIQPLDARSDLYALGALGYYMLTKRNAYPARQVRELRELWQLRPDAPHALREDTPRALSELVMTLLSLDPRGRPSSAAEVCERLRAVLPLPVENERQLAQAFLSTPTLVGRETEHAQARARLMRLRRGRGGTLVIAGASGMGRSRFLASMVLDAKVMGTSTVLVEAALAETTPYGLAAALAERIIEAQSLALDDDHCAALATLAPSLRRALARDQEEAPAAAPSKRAIEDAWLELIRLAALEHPLLLAIDDVNLADGLTLGLLGQLSARAREMHVLLAATSTVGPVAGVKSAIAQIVKPEQRIDLNPLEPETSRALLESLFGTVDGVDEAARFIDEISQGSPRVCMQYAQFMVDQGIARYVDGAWRLPERLRDHALPSTLAAMLERRVSVLSADAFALALSLALARDETRAEWQHDKRVRFEDLGKLLGGVATPKAARAFEAVDELLRVGFIEQREHDYVIAQGAIADAILRVAHDAAREDAHRHLADVFAQGDYHDPYLVAHHLQMAGEYERCHAVLMDVIANGNPEWNWRTMRLSVAARIAARQLAWWKAQNGTPHDGIGLRRLLISSCSVSDWTSAYVGDEQLVQLSADIGLTLWDATDPALPPAQRWAQCERLAEAAYAARPEAERGLPPKRAALELARCAMALSGAYVNSGDVPRARALAGITAKARGYSPMHALLADLAAIAVDRVTGREVGGRIADCIPRLMAATELGDVMRLGAMGVYLHIQALEDARAGRTRALELMDLLAASTGDTMFIVVHARYLAHAFAGRAVPARRLRKQLELTSLDDVWRRHAYMFVEAQLHVLTGDLAALNAATAIIAELAAKFEGWKAQLSYCRAQTHRLLGELDVAERMLVDALAAVQPGEHRAYPALALAHAEVLFLQRRFDDALTALCAFAARAEELKLDQPSVVSALRLRALILSAQGEHADAQEQLRSAFALARSLDFGGLPLAVLYEAQARLSVAENDPAAGMQALAALRDLIEHADAPALFAAYELLRVENKRQMHGSMHPPSDAPDSIRSLPVSSQIQSASTSSTDVSSSDSESSAPAADVLTSRQTVAGKNRLR